MNRPSIALRLVVGCSLVLVAGAAPDSAAAQAAPRTPGVRVVDGSVPAWVGHARDLGRAAPSGRMSLRVYLTPRGGTAALKAAVAAVSDPTSPSYRHFVGAATFHARFDASAAEAAAVSRWLTRSGLTVAAVAPHRRYLAVQGTTAQAEVAFRTRLHRFDHDGRIVRSNTTPLRVPRAVAGAVLTVIGLDTSSASATPATFSPATVTLDPPSPAHADARPCSSYYGQVTARYQGDFETPLPRFRTGYVPYAVCGYTGPQLRAAYGEEAYDSGLDGSGVTVAVVGAFTSPTFFADVQTYASRHGDPDYAPGQLSESLPSAFTDPSACRQRDWYEMQALGVEAVHAVAPATDVHYYAARGCQDQDFLDTLSTVVDDDSAQLVSNPWSGFEEDASADTVAAYEDVFLQGALQGTSFVYASGDDGDGVPAAGLRQLDYPSSDPYVTAVGGTSVGIDRHGRQSFATGWGTRRRLLSADGRTFSADPTFLAGATGGSSTLFDRPDYQQGVVPVSNGPGRAVPDVSMDADPTTGMLVGQTQTFPDGRVAYGEYRAGGTSLSAALFAGFTALLVQHAGGALGFLNPTIYDQQGGPSFVDVRGSGPDITNVSAFYRNSVDGTDGVGYETVGFNHDTSLHLHTGWDDITGLGQPTSAWVTSV